MQGTADWSYGDSLVANTHLGLFDDCGEGTQANTYNHIVHAVSMCVHGLALRQYLTSSPASQLKHTALSNLASWFSASLFRVTFTTQQTHTPGDRDNSRDKNT
jgi:hypothetical protein